MSCFQTLLSSATCATTQRGFRRGYRGSHRLFTPKGHPTIRGVHAASCGRVAQVDHGLSQSTPRFLSGTFRDFQRFKLKHDKLLSTFAFNCNLRHYTEGDLLPFRIMQINEKIRNVVLQGPISSGFDPRRPQGRSWSAGVASGSKPGGAPGETKAATGVTSRFWRRKDPTEQAAGIEKPPSVGFKPE